MVSKQVTQIQIRRDTTANWTANNPILGYGEPAWDETASRLKVGDGVTPWTGLEYSVEKGATGAPGAPGPPGEPGSGGTSFSGMYSWSPDPDVTTIQPGEIRGDDPNTVPTNTSAPYEMAIHQIGRSGMSNAYFEVKPGEHLIIRDADYQGVRDLLVTGREATANYVIINYTVVATPDTPVVGSIVEVRLVAESPNSDVVEGPPGPAGPTGPEGPTGPVGPRGVQGPPGVDGTDGVDGVDGSEGVQGIAGPAGAEGLTGQTGRAGADGDTGAEGPAGPQGEAGETGPQGGTGVAGPAGAQGGQGPVGEVGPDGPTGPVSTVPGPQGPPGVQGPAGADGADGVQGDLGPEGPQGTKGDAGTTASSYSGIWTWTAKTADAAQTGQIGTEIVGWTGTELHLNTQRADGTDVTLRIESLVIGDEIQMQVKADASRYAKYIIVGDLVNNGTWYTIPVTFEDEQGTPPNNGTDMLVILLQQQAQVVQGPQGPAGAQGPKGDQGAAGQTGPQGVQGSAGSRGADGASGAQGPIGATGANSTVPGPVGPAGPTGDVGPAGPTGSRGATGTTGAAGPTGARGVDSVVPGPAGPQGQTGQQGVQGTQGVKGDTGLQGVAGASAGRIFYFDPTNNSDVFGYKTMLDHPSPNAESTIVTPVSGTADVFVGSFVTDPGVPGVTTFPSGTSFRRLYVSINTGGGTTARAHMKIYYRSASGTEMLIRDEFSPPFGSQTVEMVEWDATSQVAGALKVDDRLVVKYYVARIAGTSSFSVTSYFNGTTHVSQAQTTIAAGSVGSTGPQGPAGPQGPQGVPGSQGVPGPQGAQGPVGATPTNAIQVVNHKTDGSVPRPAGALTVYWLGAATPINASASDLWMTPTATFSVLTPTGWATIRA